MRIARNRSYKYVAKREALKSSAPKNNAVRWLTLLTRELAMETVKLSTKGQLVIPKEIRDAHHLAAGTEFAVSFVGDEIRLTPLPMFPRTTVAAAAGLLAKRGQKHMDEQKTRASIRKTLKARDAATRS